MSIIKFTPKELSLLIKGAKEHIGTNRMVICGVLNIHMTLAWKTERKIMRRLASDTPSRYARRVLLWD